jgi:prolyl-tRNA editing enzyme YbaK/EbsC (Cys-tRNA(Pro) deacylase)
MTRVRQLLDELAVSYEEVRYPAPAYSAEAVAQYGRIPVGAVAKAMLLLSPAGQYYIALVPGDRRVDLDAVTQILGSRVELVARTAVQDAVGAAVGAVTPLVVLDRPHIRVICDQGLLAYEEVNVSSGDLTIGYMLDPADLVRIVNAAVAGIARPHHTAS